jgi:hypothetical protein
MAQFNVSGLSTYTDEISGELITKTLLGGNTMSKAGISKNPGIKSAKNLNILTSTIVGADGSGCGFTDAGATTYTVVPLSVDPITVNKSFCLNTLETKYLQVGMNPGSYPEDVPFEDVLTAEQSELVGRMIDAQIWLGNKSTGSGNLALADGFMAQIDAASASTINVSSTGFTSADAIAKVDEYAALIPAEMTTAGNVTLYMSFAEFSKYTVALREKNYFHITPEFNTENGVKHPGIDNLMVVPVMGLAGSVRKVIAADGNLNIGFDLESDSASFQRWYSLDNEALRYRINYKLGTAVAFPTQLVNVN